MQCAVAARAARGESMSGSIDNRKVIAVICVILAFVSVCGMLYQIKLYKMFGDYTVAADCSRPFLGWTLGSTKPYPLPTPQMLP